MVDSTERSNTTVRALQEIDNFLAEPFAKDKEPAVILNKQ